METWLSFMVIVSGWLLAVMIAYSIIYKNPLLVVISRAVAPYTGAVLSSSTSVILALILSPGPTSIPDVVSTIAGIIGFSYFILTLVWIYQLPVLAIAAVFSIVSKSPLSPLIVSYALSLPAHILAMAIIYSVLSEA